MNSEINRIISSITDINRRLVTEAKMFQDTLAMPPSSLGRLQEIAQKLCGIQHKLMPEVNKKRIVVMCADNGVVSQGVASAPQSVTARQAENMTMYKTGMSSIAHHFGAEVQVVDVGIATASFSTLIKNKKVMKGTNDISIGPAMSESQMEEAILAGIKTAEEAYEDGVQLLGAGEMGIGNTTTSSAIIAVLTGLPPEKVTGTGGGLTHQGLLHKCEIIKLALEVNKCNSRDVLDVMQKVGGLDIAAMCGLFLGASYYKIPIVIDGFISATAALCAYRLNPICRGYFIPSHKSTEAGYMYAMNEMALEPYLDMHMRLGEGSGCALMFPIIEAACVIMSDMATFDQARINDSYLEPVRREGI